MLRAADGAGKQPQCNDYKVLMQAQDYPYAEIQKNRLGNSA